MLERGESGQVGPLNQPGNRNEMAMLWFGGVHTTALRLPGTAWTRRPTRLSETARDNLGLLGIDQEVFSRPPHRAGNADGALSTS